MSFQDDDEVPLLQSSPTPFVRNSSLRITRRQKAIDQPVHPESSQPARPVTRAFVRPHDRSRPPSGHDRPPLPPPRYNEDLCRTKNDQLRKSLSYAPGGNTHSRVGGSVQQQDRPLSPSYRLPDHHDLARKSQSFSYGGHNKIGTMCRNDPVSPPVRNKDFFTFTEAGSRPLPHEPSQFYNSNTNSWNQHQLLHTQSKVSQTTQRKKTPPANLVALQNPSQLSNHKDAFKSICSLLRRPASPTPNPKELRSTEEENNQTNGDSCKDSQSSNSGGTSWSQIMARLQGRSLTPSPHRTAPQASPKTYRRVRHPSDTPPASAFRRYGSLPMQKTQPAPSSNMYLQPRVVSDLAAVRERLSRSSSVRLPRARLDNDRENDYRSTPPWRDKVVVPLPQKPLSERNLQMKRQQQPTGINDLSHVQDSDSHVEDRTGSHFIPRDRYLSQRSQSFVNDSSQDPMVTKPTRSSSLTSYVQDQQPKHETSSRPSSKTTFVKHTTKTEDGGRDGDDLIMSSSSCSSSSSSGSDGSLPGRQGKPLGPRDSLSSVSEGLEGFDAVSERSSVYSDDSGPDIWECLENNLNLTENTTKEANSYHDNYSYLLGNDYEYLVCLEKMLEDNQRMRKSTPSHIRQHFDVVFKHLELIYQFQLVLHEALKEINGNVRQLAELFRDKQFESYSHYMIKTPTVQKELHRYSTYFEEHFPDLKRNILKPSMRLNFYAMLLESFKKEALDEEKDNLQSAIDHLNQLKRQANTEMTLTTVVNSPVDLRLGGDMLHAGELFCLSGGSLQKKKYNIILFENILVITSSKMDFFKYKVHYRAEQVEEVQAVGDSELVLRVLTEGRSQNLSLKFKAKSSYLRNQWIHELQKMAMQNPIFGVQENAQSEFYSRQSSSNLMPLDLYEVYPNLLKTMTQEELLNRKPELPSIEESCQILILEERTYVRQLSSLLNPEALMPSVKLCSLIERLYEFHSKGLLPNLENSNYTKEILDCLLENIRAFTVYIDYLVVRCQHAIELDASQYISPVQHLTFYMVWLRQLCQMPIFQEAARLLLDHFEYLVEMARLRVLNEAIINGRVDFQRSGNLIRRDKMEVKTRKKEVSGKFYYALLFEKIIILTKPKSPYYEYVWDIWLDQVNFGPPTSSDSSFKLEVRQGGRKEPITYEFRSTNPTVKQEWLNCLQREMLEQAEKIRQRTFNF